MSAVAKYERRARAINSLLCVGLDSNIHKLPDEFKQQEHPQFAFNQYIIDQTHAYASAYKPNIAFYEARGDQGLRELKLTLEYLQANHPDILTICDAKRGDLGSSSAGYVEGIFDWFGFDAVTLNPYQGHDALLPFLEREDKGCIIVCRTSNPDSGDFQNLKIKKWGGKRLWEVIAEKVRDEWNERENCMLVVGATYPEDLKQARQLVGDMTLLVPGIGVQGGDIDETIHAGLNNDGLGLIISASRSVIFSDNPAESARELRDALNGSQ